MTAAREMLEDVLADFSRETGCEVGLDENNGCTFQLAMTVFNLTFLPKSGQVLLWSVIGRMEMDANAGGRARRLLEMNDGWRQSRGGTFMLDRETGLVMLADRRSVAAIGSADDFARWLTEIEDGCRFAVDALEFAFPYVDDDPLEDDDESTFVEIDGPEAASAETEGAK